MLILRLRLEPAHARNNSNEFGSFLAQSQPSMFYNFKQSLYTFNLLPLDA